MAIFWKREACGQTVLPDRSILIGQKLVENAKIQKFKCDILSNCQTMWTLIISWLSRINYSFLSISGSVLLQPSWSLHWPSHPPTRRQSLCQRWPLWSRGGSDFYHFWRRRRWSFKQQGICGRDEKQAKTRLRKAQGHWPLQLFDRCHQMCQIDPQDSHWSRGTRDLSLSQKSLDISLLSSLVLLFSPFHDIFCPPLLLDEKLHTNIDCDFVFVETIFAASSLTLFEIFIFCPKIQLWFPEKIVKKNLCEKLVNMLGFCQTWIFGQRFDF